MMVYNMEDAIIQRVKTIVLHHFSAQDVRIYLFGSWARREQKRSSDINITVEGKEDISYKITLRREKLEEPTIPQRVDIVDMCIMQGEPYASVYEKRKFYGKNYRTIRISRPCVGKIS